MNITRNKTADPLYLSEDSAVFEKFKRGGFADRLSFFWHLLSLIAVFDWIIVYFNLIVQRIYDDFL